MCMAFKVSKLQVRLHPQFFQLQSPGADARSTDCSIAPGNVGANMYSTAIAIGEKAAVIIAQDLGIQGVTEQ